MKTVSRARPATPTNTHRKTALLVGVLLLLTEVGAIAGAALYSPMLTGSDYIISGAADDRILLGALFELLLVVAAVGTAVTLYPILKRRNESVALAFVAARVLEAAAILIGMLGLLSIVTVRRQFAGTPKVDDAALSAIGSAMVALHDWAYLIGPNFALGAASLLLASLMYSSGLVPRPLAVLGLVGGSLIIASGVAVMFGAYDQMSMPGFVVALPVFAWELTLAVRLIVKGFLPVSVLAAGPERPAVTRTA